jgi:hypothetical protein
MAEIDTPIGNGDTVNVKIDTGLPTWSRIEMKIFVFC